LPSESSEIKTLAWNQTEGWIACGGKDAMLKVIKLEPPTITAPGEAPKSNLSMNQTLEGHHSSIRILSWNEPYRKLSSSDLDGLIIVWFLRKGAWVEEMINNRNKSTVCDMKWSRDGQKICIAYEDGAVIVGSVEGNHIWGKDLPHPLTHLEWSPDSRILLFASSQGEVYIYDGAGNLLRPVQLKCMKDYKGSNKSVACMSWNSPHKMYSAEDSAFPCLCIAFQNGRVQLMKHENDESPILIDTGMTVSCTAWNNTGKILAVSGSLPTEGGVVLFYTNSGVHMRTLAVPDSAYVSSVSWEGNGLRIALSVSSIIYCANIKPDYNWAYFNDSIVYAYLKQDRNDFCVVFWNVKTNERYVKYIKKLMHTCAFADHSLLVTKSEDSNQLWTLTLCNSIGCPVDTKKINIEPLFVSMNKTHIVLSSTDSIYVWQYRSQVSRLLSQDTSKRKMGRENAFNIDETPDLNALYDSERFQKPSRSSQDPVTCIVAGEGFFLVGRSSGTVNKYTIPHVALECRYKLPCRPQLIGINCNSSKISVIDINGVLYFHSLEAKGQAGFRGESLETVRKDVWDMKWSTDNPDLIVIMEKTRMFVLQGNESEDPVISSGYLCEFKDLEIKAVLLDEIFKNPDSFSTPDELILRFETRSLKDTREMVSKLDVKEAFSHVEKNPYPKLWRIVAEAALGKLELDVAQKAFVRIDDYQGLLFVNKPKKLNDPQKQKAEVAVFFKNYDEAEEIYKSIDRKDLALDMRVRIGDWVRVLQLIDQGVGNDELITTSYNSIGDHYAERFRWKKAASHYALAQNIPAMVESYFHAEDYDNLLKIVEQLPEEDPLLESIAERFQAVGMCDYAVKAYLKVNNVRAAIDCCVLLNQWNQAIELAEKNNFVQIEALLSRYASVLIEENKTIEAIMLYRKANRNTEAAKILNKIAQDLGKTQANPLTMKKIYVMAALEVDSYKKRVIEAQITGTGNTVRTLDSLITSDINTMSDKTLDNPWRGAEAFHFYLLTQRQLYEGDYESALRTSLRLAEYENILETRDIYSLIALSAFFSGYYKECSKAFVKLENLPGQTDEDRGLYEDLAVAIFVKHPPRDPKPIIVKCPGKNCSNSVPDTVTNCSECGSNFPACIVSGRPIMEKSYVQCMNCKHKAIETELQRLRLKACPLCHSVIKLRNR
jgi:WD repeat-containing protein 35